MPAAEVRVVEIGAQVDQLAPLAPQVEPLARAGAQAAGPDAALIVLPGLAPVAVLLGRRLTVLLGYPPPIIRQAARPGGFKPVYEAVEIIRA